MNKERINEFITLNDKDVISLMAQFDASLKIIDILRMNEGMGNTGYKVTTSSGVFLLKLYSNPSDGIDCAMYRYLQEKVNIPEIFCYDGSKKKYPFAYTITQFINGVTLAKYLKSNFNYPPVLASEAGRMCAEIHRKKYPCDALLDNNLNILRELPKTHEKILFLLNEKPGTHLKKETVTKLKEFINKNPALFDTIEAESVLCHGDFNYGNIMLSGDNMYFIDFEFAYAGSRYHDIGHFFRRKSDEVQTLIDDKIYNAFAEGYNLSSETPLPTDWLRLARFCDINAMLCLMNYDNVPAAWIEDIETDILSVIKDD